MNKDKLMNLDFKPDNSFLLYNSPLESYLENEGEDDLNFGNISSISDNKNYYENLGNQIHNTTNEFNFINKISSTFESSGKNDLIDNLNNKTNILNEALIRKIIVVKKEKKNLLNKKYRKDVYYKHFKVIFGKYLKIRINELKNICFPKLKIFFSSPNYKKYTGNTKKKDNYNFLSYKVKDILTYGEDQLKQNRQYKNKILIDFIEKNKNKVKDKKSYQKLIEILFQTLEKAVEDFYIDENEFEKINQDQICLFYDEYFKEQTNISLLEKNGYLKSLKSKIK